MFTGLIEDLGRVKEIRLSSSGGNLTVETSLRGIEIGDSVAVNGVCLTATNVKGNLVTFDLSKETLDRSNLKLLKAGDWVNLERALTPNKPLGGHIVQGHVDTVGVIKELQPLGEHHRLVITFEEKYLPLVVEKGSIAVDGISLTINKVLPLGVEINVIPHTFKVTNLKFRKRGDFVNLEFDILGKYVMRYLERVLRKEKLLKEFFNL
ncbi:MAG: riboflavin synthase [Gammaproteobacteria bacterium]|nr:MAG: riboflavin synthase [Gammaproteobacteria bacterium]